MITSVLLDYFFSCLLCDLSLRFFLNASKKTLILLETRGLHTATLAATSSSSLNRAEA